MTATADVLAAAAAQIGYSESPRNSNCTKFNTWYGIGCDRWCATFVSWVFAHAGMPLRITTAKGFSYTPAGRDWFRAQGRLHTAPAVGDIVFFSFNEDSTPDHVGICEAYDATTVTTIDGNTSGSNPVNGGMVARMRRNRRYAIGFGRPAYTGSPVPPTQSGGLAVSYDPNQPSLLVYAGSIEEMFVRCYIKGATRLHEGQPLANFQVISFLREGPYPNPVPPHSMGVGIDPAKWASITGADRYETLRRTVEFLGLPVCPA